MRAKAIKVGVSLLLMIFFAIGCSVITFCAYAQSSYRVGVYYFPGWKDGAESSRQYPWDSIKKFPEREPLLGWYQEGDQGVLNRQLMWMDRYGVDFVIFDWYWTAASKVRLNQVLDAYLSAKNRHGVHFSIMWANHTDVPSSYDQFDLMVSYWVDVLFKDPLYWKEDGAPVVIIFSPEKLDANARRFGASAAELLLRAKERAVKAGNKGIYFVAATQGFGSGGALKSLAVVGYSAATAYNYHFGYSGEEPKRMPSHSYVELDQGYRETWMWITGQSPIPYFVPTTSGWDKRPWGGSSDSLHDQCASDVAEFSAHLYAAKNFVDLHPTQTLKTVLICCWNEYGEGSYIEPTKRFGFQYLNVVRKVFKVR